MLEVIHMSVAVEARSPTITIDVGEAVTHLDVGGCVGSRVGLAVAEPVLGAGVAVAEDDGREPRDRVVEVCDAAFEAWLVGDEADELVVADARAAVRVHVDREALLAGVAGGEGIDCASERVPCEDGFVIRVRGCRVGDAG